MNEINQIPKIIHYCWFGRGEKPKLAKKCIASWKRYCPDYKIIEWNEDNFDISYNAYTKFCYQNKKYDFLSDYVRLLIVEKYGGIYFDTDVEVIKPLNELLVDEAFYGFENDSFVATGLGFGAIAHHCTVQRMIKQYDVLVDGNCDVITCPKLNTEALIPLGLIRNGKTQKVAGAMIYSKEYFNPYDDPTGRLLKTKNTISIHWYSKSWMSKRMVFRSKITKPLHRVFGVDCFKWIKQIEKKKF